MLKITRRTILVSLAFGAAGGGALTYALTPRLKRSGAIDKVLQSVVRITTHSVSPGAKSPLAPLPAAAVEARSKFEEAFGSGFIVDKKGYIVTNSHLIKDAYEIIVTLNDGSSVRARPVGVGMIFAPPAVSGTTPRYDITY